MATSRPIFRTIAVAALMAIAQTALGSVPSKATSPDTEPVGEPTWFSIPVAQSAPTTLVLGEDGGVWVTLSKANAIGRLDPDSGQMRIFPLQHAGSSPRVMSLGSDGNFWFSQHGGNRIGRISPDGAVATFALPTPDSQPRAVALGPDGNIWAGLFGAGKIARVTPAGEITEFPLPHGGSQPRAIAAGADGNLWFSQFGIARIGRITPNGEIAEFELADASAGPGDITTGADGNLWFLLLDGEMDGRTVRGRRVGRITPDGRIDEYALPAVGSTPINIAVGPDRNIWYTRGNRLGRVTADGSVREFVVGSAAFLVGLSAGSDRQPPHRLSDRLWFTDALNNRIGFIQFD